MHPESVTRLRACSLALALGLLSGCESGNKSSSAPVTSIAGTAAVGAPLSGAGIIVRCGSSITRNATANASGGYSVSVPTSSLPCALRATPAGGGQALHSITTGTGATLTANITPLTDLIAALAVNTVAAQTLAIWFASPSSLTAVSSGQGAAQTALQNALTAAGYTLPSPFAPIETGFTPAAGDAYDDLLEAIAAAIAGDPAVADYATLLDNFVGSNGSTLPDAVDGSTDPETAAGLELLAIYAGTWNVTGNIRGTVIISEDGSSIDFDSGKSYTISAGNVYNRIPNFPSDPRVQIELFPVDEAQQRIRIFVDPANKTQPLSFVYYPSVLSDDGAITATVGDGGGSTTYPDEAISLGASAKTNTLAAADIASAAGSYPGTSAKLALGATTTYHDSCSIAIAADGTVTLSANGETLSQSINGATGDNLTVRDATLGNWDVVAGGTAGVNYSNILLEIRRNKMTYARGTVVADSTVFPTVITKEIVCWLPANRYPTSAGSATATVTLAATASDFDSAFAGTFSGALDGPFGGTCQVTLATNGTLSFSIAGGDYDGTSLTARLAGDSADLIEYFPSTSDWNLVSQDASDAARDSHERVTLRKNGSIYQATARRRVEGADTSFSCSSLGAVLL